MTTKRTIEFGVGAAVAAAAFAVGAVAASAAAVKPSQVEQPKSANGAVAAAGKVTFNPFSITRRAEPKPAAR